MFQKFNKIVLLFYKTIIFIKYNLNNRFKKIKLKKLINKI